MVCMRKSKACQTKRIRRRRGVEGLKTLRDRPYAALRTIRTARRLIAVVLSKCCSIESMITV